MIMLSYVSSCDTHEIMFVDKKRTNFDNLNKILFFYRYGRYVYNILLLHGQDLNLEGIEAISSIVEERKGSVT